jgi:predicted nucleotidyltransferase
MQTLQQSNVDLITQTAIKQFVKIVARNYPLEQTILFGSRARGTAHEDSDADVALILSGEIQPFMKTRMALNDLAYDVLLDTGVIIQPLPVWASQWAQPESYTNPQLLRNVARDGIQF